MKYFLPVDCQCRVCLSSFKQDNGLHLPFAETLKDGATFLEKRLMTEKASNVAFLPMASIRYTADNEPNNAPRAKRLPKI